MRWMSHQVAPSWKAFLEVDQNRGTNVMGEMVDEAHLTEDKEGDHKEDTGKNGKSGSSLLKKTSKRDSVF